MFGFGAPKVFVEIIGPEGIKQSGKYETKGNQVILEKAKRGPGNPGWSASYVADNWLYYRVGWGPFKRLKRKLMILEGTENFLNWNTGEIPGINLELIKRYFQANVIKSAGATTQKVEIPFWISLLIFANTIISVISMFILTGGIRV